MLGLCGGRQSRQGVYLGQSLRFSASPDQPSQHPGSGSFSLGPGPSQPELCAGLSLLSPGQQRNGDTNTCRPRLGLATKKYKAKPKEEGIFVSPKRCPTQTERLGLGQPKARMAEGIQRHA